MKISRKKEFREIKVQHNKHIFWTIVLLFIILIALLITINIQQNNNVLDFEDCVALGNPVMESYPRQCMYKGITYIEEIEDSWRLDQIELMQHETEEFYACFGCNVPEDGPGLCVDPILEMKLVEETSERYCSQEFEVIESKLIGGERDEHGCLGPAGYTYNETLGGCVREWEQPGEVYCSIESREAEACIEIYQPVCGWNNPEKIQCIKYPCASTYSNSCFSCMDDNVEYYTLGECPTE